VLISGRATCISARTEAWTIDELRWTPRQLRAARRARMRIECPPGGTGENAATAVALPRLGLPSPEIRDRGRPAGQDAWSGFRNAPRSSWTARTTAGARAGRIHRALEGGACA
jgi:hypothetical protein